MPAKTVPPLVAAAAAKAVAGLMAEDIKEVLDLLEPGSSARHPAAAGVDSVLCTLVTDGLRRALARLAAA